MSKSGVAGLVVVLSVLLWSTPAFAHVEAKPESAAAGSTIDLALMVPNERMVNTVKVDLTLSGQQQVESADTPAHAGWSESVNVGTAGVANVVWEHGAIAPGTSDTFVVTIKVPMAGDQLLLKTLQTYADGTVDRWIDAPLRDGSEPEHPAPILKISGGAAATSTTSTPTSTVPATVPTKAAAKKKSGGLSVGGLLMGFGVAIIAVIYLRTKRQNTRESRK